MKITITILALLLCQVTSFAERPDSFICYSDRKVEVLAETPEEQHEAEHPWQNTDIPVVFNYDKKNMIIYAKETLALSIIQVGPHYTTDEYKNAVDIQATDHLGRRVTCTFVPKESKEGDMLVVKYCNVKLVYRLRKVNKTP